MKVMYILISYKKELTKKCITNLQNQDSHLNNSRIFKHYKLKTKIKHKNLNSPVSIYIYKIISLYIIISNTDYLTLYK